MFMKVKFDLYLHVGYVSKESVASGNWHPWRQGAPEGKMSEYGEESEGDKVDSASSR